MASELEQFCVIARSQKDRACANIIQQVCCVRVGGLLLTTHSSKSRLDRF